MGSFEREGCHPLPREIARAPSGKPIWPLGDGGTAPQEAVDGLPGSNLAKSGSPAFTWSWTHAQPLFGEDLFGLGLQQLLGQMDVTDQDVQSDLSRVSGDQASLPRLHCVAWNAAGADASDYGLDGQ
jgi:hypothetical protein